MKIIRPFIISDASLISCDVPETDASLWSSVATYLTGNTVLVANPSSNVTMTIANPCVITWTGHVLVNTNIVIFRTTGLLPTGLLPNVPYYVVGSAANTFNVSLTSGGAAIITTGTQSGTHSCQSLLEPSTNPIARIVTITTANPAVVTWTAHGFLDGEIITMYSTGALPTGFLPNTSYYIIKSTVNTFQLSLNLNGVPIVTTAAGSGVNFAANNSHHTYEALRSVSANSIPHKSVSDWLDLGADNRWKMFDGSITSQTTNPNSITCIFQTTGRVDSLALMNVNASSVTITGTDATLGIVYGPTTYALSATYGIGDWWSYFFEQIVRKNDFVDIDFPPYNNLQIKVEITSTGETVSCGAIIPGLSKFLGGTQYGAGVGITDYSMKTRDSFGNYIVQERSFSKRGRFTLWLGKSETDGIYKALSAYRAIPAVYVGATDYESTIIYGFYKDFNIDISYPSVSVCSVDIEGLT